MRTTSFLFLASLGAAAMATAACSSKDAANPPPPGVTSTSSSTSSTSTSSSSGASSSSTSSSSTSGSSSSGAGGASSSSTSSSSTGSSSSGGGAGGGSACSGNTPIELTVKNYLNWCDVSVAGGAASTAAVQTVCVADAMKVDLTATAASATFKLGDWHHTDGDSGSGDPGTVTGNPPSSAAAITVSASKKCAWICCPFTDGTGCPATDQCL